MSTTSPWCEADDQVVYRDSAYLGLEKREEIKQDPQLSAAEYRINRRPGRLPKVSDNAINWGRHIENRKFAVCCKVEHPYRIVKNIFSSERPFTVDCEKTSIDYTCFLPARTCICLLRRAVLYAPPKVLAPFRPNAEGKTGILSFDMGFCFVFFVFSRYSPLQLRLMSALISGSLRIRICVEFSSSGKKGVDS